MRMKSLLIALALVLTAVGAAHTAQASLSECNSGNVCMWGNNDFLWLIGERAAGGGLWAIGGDANNQMDSWANTSYSFASGYDNSNGTGTCQTFGPVDNDNNVFPGYSDIVSSWRTDRGC